MTNCCVILKNKQPCQSQRKWQTNKQAFGRYWCTRHYRLLSDSLFRELEFRYDTVHSPPNTFQNTYNDILKNIGLSVPDDNIPDDAPQISSKK